MDKVIKFGENVSVLKPNQVIIQLITDTIVNFQDEI